MDKTKEDRRGSITASGRFYCFLRNYCHRRRGLRQVEERPRTALRTGRLGSRRLTRASRFVEIHQIIGFEHDIRIHRVSRSRWPDLHGFVCASVLPAVRHVGDHPDRRHHRCRRSWTRAVGQGPQVEGCGMVTPNEVTSADGGWRVLFTIVAQPPATAEFLRSA